MAPIIFKRNKAERLPRRIITKDLYHQPRDEDGLSPLEMEKKFVVCKSPESTTPETVDSMVMTFSDDSFDEDDYGDNDHLPFGDAATTFDDKWWEEPTPAKNNTTTNLLKSMTPFSKLALENTSRRLALSPLDTNNKAVQLDTDTKPYKVVKKDASRRNHESKKSAFSSPFTFSKHRSVFSPDIDNNNHGVKSSVEIQADLDSLWKTTKSARQPYVSPFSKNTLARNAEGKHTMPPAHSQSWKEKSQWVQFTPVKGFQNNHREKTLTSPFSKRKNRRGSPLLSPLDRNVLLTPSNEETPEPKNLFNLSLEEDDDVVEIKIRNNTEEDNTDYSVISGLTKIEEVDDEIGIDHLTSCDIWGLVVKEVEEDSYDAGDGLLSNFLHNFMISTPPKNHL